MHAITTTVAGPAPGLANAHVPAATRGSLSLPIDAGRLATTALTIVALLLINKAGTFGAIGFFAILLVMLFRSPQAAFKAMAICYLGLMINQAFVPKTLPWTPGRLILPFLALFRFSSDLSALRASLFSRSWYLALLAFVAVMAVCSIVSGWFTHIALLKLFNFTTTVTAIFSGAIVLRLKRIDLSEWFVALVLAATIFGLGSVVLGVSSNFRQIQVAPGQVLTELGFNGAFLHPNLHATYATLFICFLSLVLVFGRYRQTWLVLPMIACWFAFMAKSASRTSFIASAIGLALLIVLAAPARNRHRWIMRPKFSRASLVATAVLLLIAAIVLDLASGGAVSKPIVRFVNKSSATEGTVASLDTEKILSSRKGLLELSWKNFEENRLFGIGFGVAKTEVFAQTATLLTAPAEKGFLPSAILEEGGLFGTAAFVVFLLMFMGSMLSEKNFAALVTFVAFLATNLGEVTFFSPGGAGTFGWITVAAAMILGDHCWTPPPLMLRQRNPPHLLGTSGSAARREP